MGVHLISDNKINRVYNNVGNSPLLDLLHSVPTNVLDVGCGAGGNASLVKKRYPQCNVFGITYSTIEAEIARQYMLECWVFDIESDGHEELADCSFDVLLFSHVLEHLRDPAFVLSRYVKLLRKGGQVLIAVPNVLSWRMRLRFLFGRFEYESGGVLDDTHLRFFTYQTADRLLFAQTPELKIVSKSTTGSVPLWWLRRYLLPKSWSSQFDQWGCTHWPNLFGEQILISAVKE